MNSLPPITPRTHLDFNLQDEDIPRYWLDGDAFKTRLFDAMSMTFPEGERMFIESVRHYRHLVSDEKLVQEIKDFIRQEGQHGMVHDAFNRRLMAQGVDVERFEKMQRTIMQNAIKRLPPSFNISTTAAAEHLTALMADCFMGQQNIFKQADKRIRAMYMWHAMEESEHKAVAFDVLRLAKVPDLTRKLGLMMVSLGFPFHVFILMNHMFNVDGFTFWQKLGLWRKGLPWLFGRKGLFAPVRQDYLAYYKSDFHPWQIALIAPYHQWTQSFEETKDPIMASEQLFA